MGCSDVSQMLELLRQRREDKEEKKRLERLGLSTSKVGKVKTVEDIGSWMSGGDNLMNIEYKKRGSVREWDLGKEGI